MVGMVHGQFMVYSEHTEGCS